MDICCLTFLLIAAALLGAALACAAPLQLAESLATETGEATEGCPGFAAPLGADAPRRESQRTERLVAFVEAAAEEVEQRGEAAFQHFAEPESIWRCGETYLFALDLLSRSIVFHADRGDAATGDVSTVDIDGRPALQHALEAVEHDSGRGWAFYRRASPQVRRPRWKATFLVSVTTPTGRPLAVGSGRYDLPLDHALMLGMARTAEHRLQQRGLADLEHLQRSTGPFIYRDARLVVIDPEGLVLADPLAYRRMERPSLAMQWLYATAAETPGGRFLAVDNDAEEVGEKDMSPLYVRPTRVENQPLALAVVRQTFHA